MKKEHLTEFLLSTIEEDAMIDRLFYLFHDKWKYSLEELDEIINFGIENGDLLIADMKNYDKYYDKVDWNINNPYQEIIMVDIYKYMPLLFSKNPVVPKEYEKFITD
ncbi:hypothetical protein [Campylobacter sputorum]|uniref:hypothetical protein n=1 Tax=Campylobacter sputorum TaxID=206 RepID=UPI000B78421E|nr:hypothetical protein [Campylobacter sputorum]ASM36863.1 hypothetical protein CSF_0994 [Campylobacter sputorum bv. faecalis CCUG 20703]